MIAITDPLDQVTIINFYNSLGRVDTQWAPRQGGGIAVYNYYFSGFRNAEEDPEGNQTVYYFDDKGRIKKVCSLSCIKVYHSKPHTNTSCKKWTKKITSLKCPVPSNYVVGNGLADHLSSPIFFSIAVYLGSERTLSRHGSILR